MRQGVLVLAAAVVAAAGTLTAEEPSPPAERSSPAPTATFSPSIEVLGPSVIELRCPWLKTSVGSKVELGSCDPPSCPSGWSDLGVKQSCSAHSLWCGQGCGTVGECSRYCVR